MFNNDSNLIVVYNIFLYTLQYLVQMTPIIYNRMVFNDENVYEG